MPVSGPVRPIRPEDIEKLKKDLLPDAVIEAFNEMIAQNYDHGYSSFKEKEVVKLMVSKGLTEKEIYDKHYLDIEELYKKRWEVRYESSAGPDPYFPPVFSFRARRS